MAAIPRRLNPLRAVWLSLRPHQWTKNLVLCAAVYLALNILYSFRLKEIVIVDVLSVSLGFVLRAVAGGVAIAVPISDWLLVCTLLLAVFLALAKRRHELVSLTTSATGHR